LREAIQATLQTNKPDARLLGRHPEVRAKRASKDGGRTLRGSGAKRPRTSA
jgi:hypothetical protein